MLDLHISAIGMVSSVGFDARTSCASIRAGISRPNEYSYYSQLDYATQDMEPIIVHQMQGVTEGYYFLGLWLKLAKLCMKDLFSNNNLPDKKDALFWQRTGIIAAIPNMDDDRYLGQAGISVDYLKQDYLAKLVQYFGIPILEKNLRLSSYGSSGALAAMNVASDMMNCGDIDRAIVLSVDSYINQASLEWLQNHNRLKTADNTTGLCPGEAGCCFMLESTSSLLQRAGDSLAKIERIEMGMEKQSILNDEPISGEMMKDALAKILTDFSESSPLKATIISDLNGENWKALQFSNARTANRALSDASPLIIPAASIGDVGVSVGAACICLATQVFARQYNSLKKVIITTSSEYGHVGIARLSDEI